MNDSVLKNSYILDHSTSIIFLHFNLSRSNFVVAFDATPQRDPLINCLAKTCLHYRRTKNCLYVKRNDKKIVNMLSKGNFLVVQQKERNFKRPMLTNTLDFRLSRSNSGKTKFSSRSQHTLPTPLYGEIMLCLTLCVSMLNLVKLQLLFVII